MFIRTASKRDDQAAHALLVETWHVTYDSIYGVDRVTEITDDWHSIASSTRAWSGRRSPTMATELAAWLRRRGNRSVGRRPEPTLCKPGPAAVGTGTHAVARDRGQLPGIAVIRLEVEPANAAALAFYAQNGFDEVGTVANCAGAAWGNAALTLEKQLA